MKKYINFIFGSIHKVILIPLISKDFLLFKRKEKKTKKRFSSGIVDFFPCVSDKTPTTGFDKHYIYHPAWAARVLSKTKPHEHVDISSILYFSSIISAFIPTRFYDYRPPNLVLDNLVVGSLDICSLPFADNSIESLSCMHTVEHIGLGRYGEKIDPDGDIKAINELKRVLRPGGNLLFVVPIGKPRIQFNAHRIYSYSQILGLFSGLTLKEFSLISQYGNGIIYNSSEELADKERYGCGCFLFTK